MNVRTMGVGILAVVCGISAMVLVQALRKPASGPVIDRVPVLFAASDVKPGETLLESMIEVREIPKTEAPEDALHQPSEAMERAAMTQLDKGDMIREKKLAEKGAGRGMAALIKTGMRAFTISTPSFSSSLAGFILPGNKVDVLLTVNLPGSTEDEPSGSSTTTLLQNVEILAVHTTVNTPTANKTDPDQARSVTLMVSPEDASLLDLGQNKGTLHLSLRNLKDTGSIKPKPVTLADLQLPRSIVKPKPIVVVEAPAPVETLPAFDLSSQPENPENLEVKMAIRTLRGTTAGQNIFSFVRPPSPAKANGRPSISSGPTRTALGGVLRGSGSAVGGGPPP
jgi:pilus assembly protein CpaB